MWCPAIRIDSHRGAGNPARSRLLAGWTRWKAGPRPGLAAPPGLSSFIGDRALGARIHKHHAQHAANELLIREPFERDLRERH